MIVTRWARHSRVLPSQEVDGFFDSEADNWLLFAFETNRLTVDAHSGNFSLKLVTSGEERYEIDGSPVRLTPGQLLLVNGGQRYSSIVDRGPTRAVSLFVPDHAVRELHGEVPEVHAAPFVPRPDDASLVTRLDRSLRAPAIDAGMTQEAAGELLGRVLMYYRSMIRSDALADRRRATRAELVRRTVRAREIIHDTGGKVDLDDVARAACLSKYYLIRIFRDVCGTTPIQYARRVRLDRAEAVARRGAGRQTILRAAGFQSMSGLRRAKLARTTGSGRIRDALTDNIIFKIVPRHLWTPAEETGMFMGSPADVADGYIHFSTASQMRETAATHFAGETNLLLVAVAVDRLNDALQWEASRGGELFPHLYGTLPLTSVLWVQPLPLGDDGRHVFPNVG